MSAQDSLISELEDAISHGNDERRAKTLRRVTDLFVFGSGHFSQDHIALFDGVFTHLIAHIEQSARSKRDWTTYGWARERAVPAWLGGGCAAVDRFAGREARDQRRALGLRAIRALVRK